jgi:LmbE family N-acetylglucosaminyl deacetylase
VKLAHPEADIFVPDSGPSAGLTPAAALARTTHLCVIAHQDDIEINAYPAVADCYGRVDRFFTGVVMTDGASSSRAGKYAAVTNDEMKVIRRGEQRTAAALGNYNLQLQLGYASSDVKNSGNPAVTADLAAIFGGCRPSVVYLHQPADKHDTHVACLLRCLEALRALPRDRRPARVLGVEGWRDLDWLADDQKVPMDASAHPALAEKLVAVFDSQIAGGKRYDLAAMGRRLSNATFFAAHASDKTNAISFAMDLTPLVHDETLSVADFIAAHIEKLRADVVGRIKKLG